MWLNDKVVVVTGSTTGIGRAVARRCVQEGARVLIHGRDRQRGEAVAAELGERAVFCQDDLQQCEAPARIVQRAVDAFGRLDAVVNNAAWVVRSDLDSTDADLLDRILAVNVRAPLLLIQAAAPHLEQTRGCVANIGSVNGLGGERNLLAYSISKGALLTLSKNLADALAPRQVRLFHFNVGWVLTENEYQYKRQDGLPADWPDRLDKVDIPSGKMTTPEQVAAVVAFWLSDESRPFAGTVMELEQYPFAGRNPTRTDV
jgi:NAD(P)-dependent dehydrogenase (short-subunit alcohol dehydrogenase family)